MCVLMYIYCRAADGWSVGPLALDQWRGKVAIITGAGNGETMIMNIIPLI